jgi:hypothetical protein
MNQLYAFQTIMSDSESSENTLTKFVNYSYFQGFIQGAAVGVTISWIVYWMRK